MSNSSVNTQRMLSHTLQSTEFQILFISSINYLALYAPSIFILFLYIKDSTQDGNNEKKIIKNQNLRNLFHFRSVFFYY